MTKEFKGTSPLALRAKSLPVRARVGLTLVAAESALDHLKSSHNLPIARAAFEIVRRWYDGERFDPDHFADAIHGECNEGIDICAQEAQSEPDIFSWLVLESALLYTAFHAYRAAGEYPSPRFFDVDEHLLDELDRELRAISPGLVDKVARAAEYLKQHPDASFARLKSKLSQV
jgi:immunity protein Imm6 of predicted polymorphic toxin system